MGAIIDILKGIPLSAVLKERLTQLETDMAVLKSENAVLKTENANLKAKLQKIESDKAIHGDICPYCQQPKGKLLDIKLDGAFGCLGVKRHYYQCESCSEKYDKKEKP